MPFARDAASLGALASSTTSIQATLYNLKSLVLTNWGERPNHFYLGCNLIEFVFAPNDGETHDRIVGRIEEQVSQWLPYVLLGEIGTSIANDGHSIRVSVPFSIRGQQDLGSVLEVSVPMGA